MNPASSLDFQTTLRGAWIVARREVKDQLRDWRILTPIILLTLFFPLLMNFTAQRAVSFVEQYGAPVIGDRLIPFLLMVVGFFPISISLVIALESFAGERERLSLEPLLATPLTDGQLYLGKMVASMVPPLIGSYLGVFVYLTGLYLNLGWTPPPGLLIQIMSLTTVQAVVMVSGAVVISSQTTSVRAANLLASFIIIPVAQLIIGESLIMFWGQYHVLWWIFLGLLLVAMVLGRMGLHMFNREVLLANEMDVLDLRWAAKQFATTFVGGARNVWQWYRGVLTQTMAKLKGPLLISALLLIFGYVVGVYISGQYTLPPGLLSLKTIDGGLTDEFSRFGFFSSHSVGWVLMNNLRVVALATVLGAFTFGVLGQLSFMALWIIVGYVAGNLIASGESALLFLVATVLPHGIFEIPAALIAGAAILHLGMSAIRLPQGTSLGQGYLVALAEWARVAVAVVLPLMILASIMEVYFTPWVVLKVLGGA